MSYNWVYRASTIRLGQSYQDSRYYFKKTGFTRLYRLAFYGYERSRSIFNNVQLAIAGYSFGNLLT